MDILFYYNTAFIITKYAAFLVQKNWDGNI